MQPVTLFTGFQLINCQVYERIMLIEKDRCIFEESQIELSHGYEGFDEIAKEAFVNHIHIDSDDREPVSNKIIKSWSNEMKAKWPGKIFRIYRQIEEDKITIRFHFVKNGQPNWCDSGTETGIEIINVKT